MFDGKPPALKEYTLQKRRERKVQAEISLEKAQTEEEEAKHAKRTVRMTQYHTETAQTLLTLLGVPFVTAPSEAEQFCAALNKSGSVDGVATEDMDALTFGCTAQELHRCNGKERQNSRDKQREDAR